MTFMTKQETLNHLNHQWATVDSTSKLSRVVYHGIRNGLLLQIKVLPIRNNTDGREALYCLLQCKGYEWSHDSQFDCVCRHFKCQFACACCDPIWLLLNIASDHHVQSLCSHMHVRCLCRLNVLRVMLQAMWYELSYMYNIARSICRN